MFSLALALFSGSAALSWGDLLNGLLRPQPGLAATLIWELRLPRAAAAFVVGALLALAGALMQVLLRNPLADPYVLGISGGAAVAVLGGMLVGLAGFWLNTAAFAGAMLSMLIVFGLAHGQGSWTPTRLLLTGIVVAAGWGAVITLLLSISPDNDLRGMLFWLMGDITYDSFSPPTLLVLAAGLAAAYLAARPLNLLLRGELQAAALGVSVAPLRLLLYGLASFMTATAVSMAGTIGFVGLVVPHMLRLLGAADYRVLLPAAVLLGGSLLLLADTLARTVVAPQQLPVGVVTAFIGVPLFLFLLYRHGQTDNRSGM